MKAKVPPGKFIIAVSGGVDSVVLLDLLAGREDLDLVVAHFNHGIRDEAGDDEKLVVSLANKYGLNYEVGYGRLGASASEEQARDARYSFLNDVKDRHEASAIITAHHQDDLIETAIINILRGTGPRGLIAISANREIIRPLLDVPKADIYKYANEGGLAWVEDSSNRNPRYLRNVVRQMLAEKLSADERQEILDYIAQVGANHEEADGLVANLNEYLFEDGETLKRSSFIFLPNDVSNEVLARWLRENGISADRPLINRLAMAVKTARPGTRHDIDGHYKLKLTRSSAHLEHIN